MSAASQEAAAPSEEPVARAWELVWPGSPYPQAGAVTKDERIRDGWIDGYAPQGATILPLFASPAVAPVADAKDEREVVWLIKRRFEGGARWYAESETGWHWWAHASEAKRFPSKAEAEAFPIFHMIADDPAISITEHVFMDANP